MAADQKVLRAYLIFTAKGISGTRTGKPNLRPNEYAVQVVLSVPASIFAADLPTVTIAVPERAIIEPTVEVTPAPTLPAVPRFDTGYTSEPNT